MVVGPLQFDPIHGRRLIGNGKPQPLPPVFHRSASSQPPRRDHGSGPTPTDAASTIWVMSVPVEMSELRAAVADYGWAYLLTVGEQERPHVVAVSPRWDGDELSFGVGRSSARNATARPDVTLCYPPSDTDGYSLIVDGRIAVEGEAARFAPAAAVLHRPAAPGAEPGPTGCTSDCVPLGSRSAG